MSPDVRVGDRYIRGDERITVTKVSGAVMEYAVMSSTSRTTYTSTGPIPPCDSWTLAGRGPVPAPEREMCLVCGTQEAEPGMIYCSDCADVEASTWAGLTDEQIEERVTVLLVAQLDDQDEKGEKGGKDDDDD